MVNFWTSFKNQDQQIWVYYLCPLKVLSSENLGGSKLVSVDRYCTSIGCWNFLFYILKGYHLGLVQKMFYRHLRPIISIVRKN